MPLELVPKRDPEPKEAVRTRIKKLPRPDGMLQCPECGGRSVCKVENSVIISKGRRIAGTTIVKDVCDDCRQIKKRIVQMRTGDERPTRLK